MIDIAKLRALLMGASLPFQMTKNEVGDEGHVTDAGDFYAGYGSSEGALDYDDPKWLYLIAAANALPELLDEFEELRLELELFQGEVRESR